MVDISTLDTWQTVVDANPAGTTYNILAGVHRGATVSPKDGDTFVFASGAIMNGSSVLTGWANVTINSKSVWRVDANGRTFNKTDYVSGYQVFDSAHPRGGWAIALFADDTWFDHVASIDQLGAGKWYFDESNDFIYIGEDPTALTVELTDTEYAFDGGANNITIQGPGVIEKYNPPVQQGAVRGSAGTNGMTNMTFDGMTVQYCTATGFMAGEDSVIKDSKFLYCGMMGMSFNRSHRTLVQNCEIAYNNAQKTRLGFSAAGCKSSNSDDQSFINCYVHDNDGVGLWSDIDVRRCTYRGNICEANTRYGIYIEISQNHEIYLNFCKNNYFSATAPGPNTGQIHVANSKNVNIYQNTVVTDGTISSTTRNLSGITANQTSRGQSRNGEGEWLLQNLKVFRNKIIHINYQTDKAPVNGIWGNYRKDIAFDPESNQWYENEYFTDDITDSHFEFQLDPNQDGVFNGTNSNFTWWNTVGADIGGGFDENGSITAVIPTGIEDAPTWPAEDSNSNLSPYKRKILSLDSELSAYLPLNDASGSTASNIAPEATWNGSYGAGVTLAQDGILTGDDSLVAETGGADSHIDLRSTAFNAWFTGALRDNFMMSFWFEVPVAYQTSSQTIVRIESSDFGIIFRTEANGKLRIIFKPNSSGNILDNQDTDTTTSPMHFAFIRSRSTNFVGFYIDGVLVASTTNNAASGTADVDRAAIYAYSTGSNNSSTGLKVQDFVIQAASDLAIGDVAYLYDYQDVSGVVNLPPAFVAPPDQLFIRGEAITVIPITITDTDSTNPPVVSLEAAPPGIDIVYSGSNDIWNIQGIPTEETVGSMEVGIRAADGDNPSLSTLKTFAATVNPPANDAPIIQQIANQSHVDGTENIVVSIVVIDSDSTEDPVVTAAPLPLGIQLRKINRNLYEMYGSVTKTSNPGVDKYTVIVTATDGDDNSIVTTTQFTWAVTEQANTAPVFISVSNAKASYQETEKLAIFLSVSDSDSANAPVLTLQSSPAGIGLIKINDGLWQIVGSPNIGTASSTAQSIVVRATDGDNNSLYTDETISVFIDAMPQNNAPTIGQVTNISVVSGNPANIPFTVIDPDSETAPIVTIENEPTGLVLRKLSDTSYIIDGTVDLAESGNYDVVITAVDGDDETRTSTRTFRIAVSQSTSSEAGTIIDAIRLGNLASDGYQDVFAIIPIVRGGRGVTSYNLDLATSFNIVIAIGDPKFPGRKDMKWILVSDDGSQLPS